MNIDLTTERGQFAVDLVGGSIGGTLAMHASRKLGLGGDVNYGRVLSDAFGNTLANAVSGQHARWASGAANSEQQARQARESQHLLAAAVQGLTSGRVPVGHPALMLLGGGVPSQQVQSTEYVPGTYTDGVLNLDSVTVSASSNGWDSWVWSGRHNQWVSSSRVMFDPQPRRMSWGEMHGDVRRSNEIDFSGFNARNAIPIGPTSQPVTRTIPTPSIGPVQRQPMSALDTTLSMVTQLAKFSMANSDRNLLAVKDGMNWVRERSKGMVDNANSPWEAAAGSVLYAINSVTNSVVSSTVDMARLTTSHQERVAFADGMTALFTTDPRRTAVAAWGQWNQLSYDDKLSNVGAVVVGLPKALGSVRALGNVPKKLALQEGGAVQDLLYGARVGEGLPGSAGVAIPSRPSPVELANLTQKHGVEFAVTYKYGAGPNGGGGQYHLFSGNNGSVRVPLEADRMLIYHTHPRGTRVASEADMDILETLKVLGSPQRSSQIVPVGSDKVVRFGPQGWGY